MHLRFAIPAFLSVGLLLAEPPVSTPLAPRPSSLAPRSGFTTLTPADTGIDAPNAYDDPLMWSRHYREFSLGAIGTGLAAGDVDGDGLPDLFIVNKCGPNRLYRNLGDFRFVDVSAAAGVAGPAEPEHWQQGAAFADIDNDGDLDLHVCRWNAPNLLYVNDGTGTFTEEAASRGLAVSSASSQIFFADIDHDGDLDAYLQTNLLNGEARPNGEPDFLFANDGTGHFTDVTAAAGLRGDTQGHSATWWDYDHDGWLDLYVANDFKDPDILYHNNRDGTFTNTLSHAVPHTPHSSMGADFGDLDNNGFTDLLVADMAATTHEKNLRGMAHIRANMKLPESPPRTAVQLMRNALFLNRGDGRMLEAAYLAGLAASDWTWSVRLEDFDNDGDTDAWFSNGMVRELHSTDITGRMQRQESMAARTRIMRDTPPLAEANLAFRNDGDLRFTDVSTEWRLGHRGVSFGAVTADFDRDGDLDLAYSNYDAPATLVRNDSTAGHAILISLRGDGRSVNTFGYGATVEIRTSSGLQSRTLIPQRGYLSSSEPVLHFGLGDDDHIEELRIRWRGDDGQSFGSLAADRHWTLVLAAPAGLEPANRIPSVLRAHRDELVLPLPDANVSPPQADELPYHLDRLGPGVAVGDINGDAIDDVILSGNTGHPGEVRTSVNATEWVPSNFTLFSGTTATADAQPLLVEINGDGHPDLLLPQGGTARPAGDPAYAPRAFLNDGRGGFDRAPAGTLPALPLSAGAAVAADFDRDGDLDVFLGARLRPGAYPESPDSAFLRNEGGRLAVAHPDTFAALGLVTSALATDVDNDGWPDLLIARDWGTILYLHNDDGQAFTDRSASAGFAAAGSGWWSSLAGADFNGDGRMDYAAGNLGLNTTYQPPLTLFRGVFEDGADPILIEAITEMGVLYPRRSLTVLGSLIPTLKRKVRTHDAYSTMRLDQLLGAERIASAQRYEATELRSGVFLSKADGTYAFSPLPRIPVQLAPVYGLVALDANADGHTDLIGAQNLYNVRPETGRFDGGLGFILHGDGKGGFNPSPAPHLNLRHDVKGLAVIDLGRDGRPDLYATRNNDTTAAIELDQGTYLALRLIGPPTNPTGIGTRVTVVYSSSHSTSTEVAAGGGHRSQSTPTVFIGYDPTDPPREIIFRWPNATTNTLAWPAEPPPILNIRLPD